jgi:hypothetical protein
MGNKFKWFIHEYYFAIIASTFFILSVLSAILYLKGFDWKVLITIFGGLLSFFYFVQKQQLDEAKFINELFIKFNQRYDRMNERLNNILESCREGSIDQLATKKLMFFMTILIYVQKNIYSIGEDTFILKCGNHGSRE